MWHQTHIPSFQEEFYGQAPVNRAVVDVHNQSLSMRKEVLVERLTNLRGIICVVEFSTSLEPIDDIELMLVPDDCEHEFLLSISVPVFVPTLSSAEPTFGEGQGESKTRTHRLSLDVSNRLFSQLLDRESFVPSVPCILLSICLSTGAALMENTKI
jgi:hypothetical protein